MTTPHQDLMLRDGNGRAVPQYFDYALGRFKPISIEDVSHIDVYYTSVLHFNGAVSPNQYLDTNGQWRSYDPLTFRAEHDEDIDVSLFVKSVNGILPDANGNIELICDHPDLSPYVKSVEGLGPDAIGNVDLDLSDYALLSDIPEAQDLSHLATLLDLEDFATTAQLDAYAKLVDIPAAQDLSHLATRGELQQLERDLGEYLEDFAQLEDLLNLVERDELPEFNDFATKAEVYQELNNYVNHEEAQIFARLTELDPYALKSEIPKVPKFYSAIATVTELGAWSVDYSSEGFTKVLSVTPTPLAQNETAAHMPTHSNLTSISNTSASGIAYKASSAGLLAAMQQVRAEAGTLVQVLVIGE